MNIYLAGTGSRLDILTGNMNVFLAGNKPYYNEEFADLIKKYHPFILDSYYYIKQNNWFEKVYPLFGDFLLDSGAFSIRDGNLGDQDWDKYIDEYSSFVKHYKIKKYFELDIDNVIGYDEVKKLTQKLEEKVGWQCIPVWHLNRGFDSYVEICKNYNYVALGGIVVGAGTKNNAILKKNFSYLLDVAHRNGAKVHGLGITGMSTITKCRFDSVDSTAWLCGNRFGYVETFKGEKMVKTSVPQNKRIKDSKFLARYNFEQWCKFQKWAKCNL